MKKHVIIILFGLIIFYQNKNFAVCQEIETIQTETKQYKDKKEKRLKKQQEKEEKARLKEANKQLRIEKKILLKENEKKNEKSNNELNEKKNNSKNNKNDENDITDRHETDTNTNIENGIDENLTKDQVDNPSQKELKRSIQQKEKTTKQKPKQLHNLSTKEKTSIWVVVIGIIFLWITRYRYKKKCNCCKKWNAMKKIRTECIDEKPSVIYKKREMKNSKGEVINTWTDSIPATIYYYHIHRKCKHCGYKDHLSKSDKREN